MIGYLALIAAFTLAPATAYATHLVVRSSDIVDGEVRSVDIGNDQVRSADVRDDTLTAGGLRAVDLGPNSIGTSEVGPDALTAEDLANNIIGSEEVVDNALEGVDIKESTLAEVPSALLGGFGRTGAESNCDPETTTHITCAATGVINVPPGARALLLARVRASTEGTDDSGNGECRLGTSSIGTVPNTGYSFVLGDFLEFEMATLIGVTPPLPAGPTDFGIDCNQIAGGSINYREVSATVVLISGS
ncbi:hypothetical protein D0Z08_29875 [Nocardioides immobilis]|uniref:Uncharacterized protein n=2 Tax=Nocardioides immobilis TaxID=2049295 RepID=A0A417XT07_9ACTN|nr:hypothetical protein D0Z08_29875 [Nocardioides immobilis]